jgi:hypothetical protein
VRRRIGGDVEDFLAGDVPVSSDVVSTVTSSVPVLATLSSVTVPLVLLKRPRLVDVPKWPISNVANEWLGSMA